MHRRFSLKITITIITSIIVLSSVVGYLIFESSESNEGIQQSTTTTQIASTTSGLPPKSPRTRKGDLTLEEAKEAFGQYKSNLLNDPDFTTQVGGVSVTKREPVSFVWWDYNSDGEKEVAVLNLLWTAHGDANFPQGKEVLALQITGNGKITEVQKINKGDYGSYDRRTPREIPALEIVQLMQGSTALRVRSQIRYPTDKFELKERYYGYNDGNGEFVSSSQRYGLVAKLIEQETAKAIGWKMYTSRQNDFSFFYPPEWQINESSSTASSTIAVIRIPQLDGMIRLSSYNWFPDKSPAEVQRYMANITIGGVSRKVLNIEYKSNESFQDKVFIPGEYLAVEAFFDETRKSEMLHARSVILQTLKFN
jgi:hypothetical protein